MSEGIELSHEIIETFDSRALLTNSPGAVNSAQFSRDGQHLLTGSDDGFVRVYDVAKAKCSKVFQSKRFGARLARFLHNGAHTALLANRYDVGQDLRYWDFHENKYVRRLTGHRGVVKNLCVHPFSDMVISVDDFCAMIWDLRKNSPVASIPFPAPSNAYFSEGCCAFDPSGMVFSVVGQDNEIRMFDSRDYSAGQFGSHEWCCKDHGAIRQLQFSPDGNNLLVNTNIKMCLVDAFDFGLKVDYQFDYDGISIPTFSPDDKYVFCSGMDASIMVFETETGKFITALGGHLKPPRVSAFSPRDCLLATCGFDTALWTPRDTHMGENNEGDAAGEEHEFYDFDTFAQQAN